MLPPSWHFCSRASIVLPLSHGQLLVASNEMLPRPLQVLDTWSLLPLQLTVLSLYLSFHSCFLSVILSFILECRIYIVDGTEEKCAQLLLMDEYMFMNCAQHVGM